MTTFAALYVNSWAKQGEKTDRGSMQAQLIACRAHAVACGYSVQGVFANLAGGRDGQRGASGDLLELVQNWLPSSNGSEEVGGLVVIVYDGRQLLKEDGRPDPVARLIAAYGVRVESALPPHSVPEVNTYFEPAAVQIASQTMRDLLGVRDSAPLVRAPAETIGYPSGTAGDVPWMKKPGERLQTCCRTNSACGSRSVTGGLQAAWTAQGVRCGWRH